jgi:CRP/FNR family transcriptional regulator, cyclic AMP receptor protein
MSEDIVLDDLADAWGHSETVDLKAGDVLFREGDDANAMYIVKTGSLRILSGSTVYETVRAGGIVGEMAIIDEDLPRSATVIAGTHAELLEIDMQKFLRLVEHSPNFALSVMRTITRRLRVMNRRYQGGARA